MNKIIIFFVAKKKKREITLEKILFTILFMKWDFNDRFLGKMAKLFKTKRQQQIQNGTKRSSTTTPKSKV